MQQKTVTFFVQYLTEISRIVGLLGCTEYSATEFRGVISDK